MADHPALPGTEGQEDETDQPYGTDAGEAPADAPTRIGNDNEYHMGTL